MAHSPLVGCQACLHKMPRVCDCVPETGFLLADKIKKKLEKPENGIDSDWTYVTLSGNILILFFSFFFKIEIGFVLARRLLLFGQNHLRDGSSRKTSRPRSGKKKTNENKFFCCLMSDEAITLVTKLSIHNLPFSRVNPRRKKFR